MTTVMADTGNMAVVQPTGVLRWKCIDRDARIRTLQQEYRTIEYRMHKPYSSTSEWRDVPVIPYDAE